MKKYSNYEYKRVNIDELTNEFDSLIRAFEQAESVDIQNDVIQKANAIFSNVSTYEAIAHLNFSRDTENESFKAENEFYDNIGPSISELSTKFSKVVLASKFREALEKKWGKQYFVLKEMELKSFDPKIKDLMLEEAKLKNEYTILLASAKIEFQGETYNLSGLGPFHTDADREVRKASYKARYSFFDANAGKLDELYDKLVKLRHKMALELGFENYVELGYLKMGRSDYNADDVAGYRQGIVDHVVPLVGKLHELRKKVLGLETLYVYDGINFLEGNPKPKGTPEELIEAAQKMYHELSEETGEFFDIMINEELMDLVNRKGKRGGGFCTGFPDHERPYIFANFNGTAHDVTVLTHEAGHAFQSYLSRKQPLVEYLWPSMESAEIHSMSMEFITWPWMESFFKEETERFKYMHMMDSVKFLPYGACVDHFQHWVYENPNAAPKERKEKWSELELIYLPMKNYDDIDFLNSGGMWQGQLHIYQMPFYYIDYTLAQICAFQFWMKNEEDKDKAWSDYLTLCKAGGSLPFTGLIQLADLMSPFEEGILKDIPNKIETWLDSIDVESL